MMHITRRPWRQMLSVVQSSPARGCSLSWQTIFLCDLSNRHLLGKLVNALASDSRYESIPPDQATFEGALNLYRQRPDKAWSLTDCTSFILMQQRSITDALTGDRHFQQAGFNPLFI